MMIHVVILILCAAYVAFILKSWIVYGFLVIEPIKDLVIRTCLTAALYVANLFAWLGQGHDPSAFMCLFWGVCLFINIFLLVMRSNEFD